MRIDSLENLTDTWMDETMEPQPRDPKATRDKRQRPDANSQSGQPTPFLVSQSYISSGIMRWDETDLQRRTQVRAEELERERSHGPSRSTAGNRQPPPRPILTSPAMTGPELQALMEWLEVQETPPPTPPPAKGDDQAARPSKEEEEREKKDQERKRAERRLKAIAKRIRKLVGKMNTLFCTTDEYARGIVELEALECEIVRLVPLVEGQFIQAPESCG